MTVDEAVTIIKDGFDKKLTNESYLKYKTAESKIIKVIATGKYKLVDVSEVSE